MRIYLFREWREGRREGERKRERGGGGEREITVLLMQT